jgi:UDPglucose 6-dehydrogenase
MAAKIEAALGGSVKDKNIAILGITFKANTDDISESPALYIMDALLAKGAKLHAYDPQGMEHAKAYFRSKNVQFAANVYAAAQNAEAVVIITEWNEFRHLDFEKLKAALGRPLLIDLRNLYTAADVREQGMEYVSVGRN